MQDIHSIGGGRIFGGTGGIDRRLRHHHNLQALKCPRCDSPNTKFCYYNNYNLSQPRHFCKGCRRYWTKGGVLRNVPVGGGCRKNKRSSKTTSTPGTSAVVPSSLCNKSNSHSSSDSSSLTRSNNNTATTEALSAPPCSSSNSNLVNVPDSKFFTGLTGNPNFESGLLEHGSDCGIFAEIGTFTNLITPTNNQPTYGIHNNTSEISQFTLNHEENDQQPHQWENHQQRNEKVVSMVEDEVKMLELPAFQNRSSNNNVGFGSLDWQGGGDQGLFDLTNTVDQSYWSQTQWTDQDHSNLYLP